jgi:hypothetical protein
MTPYRRGGTLVRPFTAEEDALMEAMRVAGAGTTAIARALAARSGHPRSAATVNMRLKALARRAEGE